MRGFLSFEEHFSSNRARHYESLQMRLPVNFYEGRNDPDHTPWLEHFIQTIAEAAHARRAKASALHRIDAPRERPWVTLHRRQQQLLSRLFARALEDRRRAPELAPGDLVE